MIKNTSFNNAIFLIPEEKIIFKANPQGKMPLATVSPPYFHFLYSPY